jgi:3',5'-nucleoside bisphosphate phosphatase
MRPYDTRRMFDLIDLHTHSHHSDGILPPAELVRLAALRKVQLLALTDHDTVAGLAEAETAAHVSGMAFVTGVEITAGWRGQEIHVVGLGIDPHHEALTAHLAHVVQLRRSRIAAIGERLRRDRTFRDTDPTAAVLAASAVPTRMHVARAIVALGVTKTTQEAFDRWLARGCKGQCRRNGRHWRQPLPPSARRAAMPCWRIRTATSCRPARATTSAASSRTAAARPWR